MKSTYFQKLLAKLMQEHKVNQKELAKGINVRQSQISNYLTGKCLPSYPQMRALSNFFNVSADQLCDTNLNK